MLFVFNEIRAFLLYRKQMNTKVDEERNRGCYVSCLVNAAAAVADFGIGSTGAEFCLYTDPPSIPRSPKWSPLLWFSD